LWIRKTTAEKKSKSEIESEYKTILKTKCNDVDTNEQIEKGIKVMGYGKVTSAFIHY